MASTDLPPVRFVCFDLGGVLVRVARDWADACARAGVAMTSSPDAMRLHHDLMIRYETGDLDQAGYLAEVPRCVPDVAPDAVVRVFDAWLLGLYPGAADLIDELRSRGLIVGCLSNTNDRHWRTLRGNPAYAALNRLDHHFASHELRAMKPDERAYRHVEARTGLGGGQIIFFDDRPENVAAARAVGWRAERIDPAGDAVAQIRESLAVHGVL